MAEVADFNISINEFEEDDDEVETLTSISYWPYEFEQEEIYSSDSDPDSDPFSPRFPPHHLDHESDSVTELNLSTDLFEETPSDPNRVEEPFFRVDDENNEMGSSNYLDVGLGLDTIAEEEQGGGGSGGFVTDEDVCSEDFCFGRRFGDVREDGLRVVGIGSDSDEEEVDLDDEIGGVSFGFGDDEDDGEVEVEDDVDIPLCWDCLRIDDRGRESNEFYEWEDVGERVEDREVNLDFEERTRAVLDSIQQVVEGREERIRTIEIERREETMRNLEWQVLLQFNNLERNVELEHEFDHDDFTYPAEYEMLFGQFAESDYPIHGSPPTAKSVIENLPSIVLTEQDIKNKGSLCAVCKDEISTDEQAKQLPCCHYYHGDCIIPWLNIRNTCPVCRFELLTDDPDYEQRKAHRAQHDSSGVSQVHLSPPRWSGRRRFKVGNHLVCRRWEGRFGQCLTMRCSG